MPRSHWKKGHTVYLSKDYKFKHSIPDLLQWLSANKVIWKSFFLLAPVKCLPSLKYFQRYSWPSTQTSVWLLVTHGATIPSYDGWFAKLLFCLLLILCQTVCRKNYIKCLTRHILYGSSSPTPLYYPPHKTMGGKGGIAWKYKACCACFILQRFFWNASKTLNVGTHANKNEREQALPSELDRSREKGKGKKQGNKS